MTMYIVSTVKRRLVNFISEAEKELSIPNEHTKQLTLVFKHNKEQKWAAKMKPRFDSTSALVKTKARTKILLGEATQVETDIDELGDPEELTDDWFPPVPDPDPKARV